MIVHGHLFFLWGLCGYAWVNILTFSPCKFLIWDERDKKGLRNVNSKVKKKKKVKLMIIFGIFLSACDTFNFHFLLMHAFSRFTEKPVCSWHKHALDITAGTHALSTEMGMGKHALSRENAWQTAPLHAVLRTCILYLSYVSRSALCLV